MKKLDRLVIASDNPGKLIEFEHILSPLGTKLIAQGKLGVKPVPEPHITFVENAIVKARHASKITGLPCLADDSGLCVDALNDEPGVLSARYASMYGMGSTDSDNNNLLLQNMANALDRSAIFIAVIVFVRHADDPRPIIAEGVWNGEIAREAAGSNGFGYDPLFYIPMLQKTAAELDIKVKNSHSHRGRALALLLKRLEDEFK